MAYENYKVRYYKDIDDYYERPVDSLEMEAFLRNLPARGDLQLIKIMRDEETPQASIDDIDDEFSYGDDISILTTWDSQIKQFIYKVTHRSHEEYITISSQAVDLALYMIETYLDEYAKPESERSPYI